MKINKENTPEIEPQENKMGTMPINKLLLTMSVPMMISMLVQALYNVVDSIFVAQISENALTAVSLAFPVQMLITAVMVGTGVGVNSFLSRSLGEKDFESVKKVAVNGVFLAWMSSLVFVLIGIFLAEPFFKTQTSSPEIIKYGVEYLSTVCIFSIGIFSQVIFERLLISTGKTMYSMISQTVGAVTNIILDPIFIFGFLGVPAMGVRGAAIATVIGQCFAALIAFYFNIKKNDEVPLSFKGFRPDLKIIKKIYAVGIPTMVMQSIGSLMTYSMNKILISFTPTATAVFGVYFKLQSIIFMPVFGLNNGMVPIVAYNFGARNPKRIVKTIKLSLVYAISVMFIGFLIFQTFPNTLLRMFNASNDMVVLGSTALRIISTHFMFAGFCIVLVSVFQALGYGLRSMFISITRQLVVLLPTAWILARVTNNVSAVWWAFPVSELVSLLLCLYFIKDVYNTKIKTL
ncbi:MAG: MATE family efflux transporter [Clostridioides sp.]|nr:MATE family efflux transporter [Clostridioides sp.]